MKRPRTHPLGLSVGRRSQEHARSIITEAASRDWGGPIIAALHLVFVSLLRSRPRSTGRRSYGGPAIMIMHRVNLGVGVPGMEAMGGPPGKADADVTKNAHDTPPRPTEVSAQIVTPSLWTFHTAWKPLWPPAASRRALVCRSHATLFYCSGP